MIQIISPKWDEGVKHDGAVFLTGTLRKVGVQEKDATNLITEICRITGDNEVNDRLRAVADTFKKPLNKIKGISGIKEVFGEDVADWLENYLDFDKRGYENKKERSVYLPYFEDEERLYLDVKTENGYMFCYLDDGKVKFTDEIIRQNNLLHIKPRELPWVDGSDLPIVKLPTEEIKNLEIPAAETLFEEIKSHLAKYIDAPEKDIELFSYYVLFTWFYLKVDVLPYLRLLADTGKGKSRIRKVVGDICFYPVYVGGSSSFSGMFRYNEQWHGTLIIDEADIQGGEENKFIKYLNLGFEKGQPFILTDKQNPKKQEFFDPFSPKIIAMRKNFNDDATEGRCLSISPHELTNKDIPIVLPPEYEQETEKIRNKIALFTMKNWSEVDGSKMISYADLGLEARLQQLAMPLSIIFQVWADGDKKFREYMKYRQEEIKKDRSESWSGSIFNAALELATTQDSEGNYPEYIGSKDIADIIGTTAKKVGDALRAIGFEKESKNIYTDDGKRRHYNTWVVNSSQKWKEIITRYYYDPENNNWIDIPKALKGSKYIDQ